MRTKIVIAVIFCGAALSWSVSIAQNQKPKPETVQLISSIQGPALYKAYCAVCHANDGKGAGPMAESLKVRPTDLTRISARNGGKFPLTRIEKIISGDEQLAPGHGTKRHADLGTNFLSNSMGPGSGARAHR